MVKIMERLRRQLRNVFLLFGAVSFLFISNAIANGGGPGPPPLVQTVPISAEVGKYARITVISQPMNFGTFSGVPNVERGPKDNAVFEVETNTDLNLKFSAGDLSKGPSSLKTAYQAGRVDDGTTLGYFNKSYPDYVNVGDLVISLGQAALTTKKYECLGWAKTGTNISSQEAGDYSATITLTVSAP